jgi:translocation and assembly module TamB
VTAKLKVDAGFWQLAKSSGPRLSDDVVIRAEQAARTPLTPRPKMEVNIETDLGRGFYFRGAGLESRLSGTVRLESKGLGPPRATGTIQAKDGRFEAYGQELAIERGMLNFQGLLDNPALNVLAVRKDLPVEAGVEVSGFARKPVIKLVSDPDVPDAEKLSWLVLGHGLDQTGGRDTSLLLAAAGSILGSESGGVTRQLKQNFGIDELGVRSGTLGGSDSRATSRVAGSGFSSSGTPASEQIFSVGKRLSDNVLISYEQVLGKTDSVVKLTIGLSRRLSVVGRAGTDQSVDVLYGFSFGK